MTRSHSSRFTQMKFVQRRGSPLSVGMVSCLKSLVPTPKTMPLCAESIHSQGREEKIRETLLVEDRRPVGGSV